MPPERTIGAVRMAWLGEGEGEDEGEGEGQSKGSVGLGRLPSYLPSIASVLLFNSDENPYKAYNTLDNLLGKDAAALHQQPERVPARQTGGLSGGLAALAGRMGVLARDYVVRLRSHRYAFSSADVEDWLQHAPKPFRAGYPTSQLLLRLLDEGLLAAVPVATSSLQSDAEENIEAAEAAQAARAAATAGANPGARALLRHADLADGRGRRQRQHRRHQHRQTPTPPARHRAQSRASQRSRPRRLKRVLSRLAASAST